MTVNKEMQHRHFTTSYGVWLPILTFGLLEILGTKRSSRSETACILHISCFCEGGIKTSRLRVLSGDFGYPAHWHRELKWEQTGASHVSLSACRSESINTRLGPISHLDRPSNRSIRRDRDSCLFFFFSEKGASFLAVSLTRHPSLVEKNTTYVSNR
ncbi:hypothetical protein BC827DRAFT_139486 [Russula dissimulans]|nr:hypothetical protein BC827DRAFT_139486 [Russula dissimulans]